jgi:hypothetical protein
MNGQESDDDSRRRRNGEEDVVFCRLRNLQTPTIEKLNTPPQGLGLQKQQQYAIPFPHLLLRIAHRKNTR